MVLSSEEAYLKGRLEGLYQLVSILKDTIAKGKESETPVALEETLVEHIYDELTSILNDLKKIESVDGQTYEKVKTSIAKTKSTATSPAKHVSEASDLVKALLEAKKE